jgi:hypothetical protein
MLRQRAEAAVPCCNFIMLVAKWLQDACSCSTRSAHAAATPVSHLHLQHLYCTTLPPLA